MTLESGTELGPYRVTRRLGAGGMGEVYAAGDPRLGREVAIKVLPPGMARDPEALKRFQQESLAVAALNHPNIVQIYDVGMTAEGAPYLVMELLEGESLRARMGQKPMAVRKVAAIAAQLARALGAAHAKGITHRDLKPENAFLTRQGPVKVLDFGLAKLAAQPRPASGAEDDEATRALRTQAGMVLGTIGYMSPEQVQGLPADPRSDLFALGVVMWEMLSGSRPFGGNSAIDTMHAILHQDPPEIAPELGLPPAMERILRRCLEKDPADRFQSAQDLAFQLESLAEASGMARTVALPAAEPEAKGAWPPLHRLLYPLPVRLPAALKACFWDRLQLSAAYLALVLGLAAFTGGFLHFGRSANAELRKRFEPAADSTGTIQSAAVSRNGRYLVYAVSGEDGVTRLFYRDGPDIHSATEVPNPPATGVLAVSDAGSVLLRGGDGAILRVDLGGDGSTMPVATRALEADLSPDGTRIALLRQNREDYALEYPQGQVIYRSSQKLLGVKVSPQGDAVAFFERDPKTFLYHARRWSARGLEAWKGGGPLSPRGGFFEFALRGTAWNADGTGLYIATQRNQLGLLKAGGETLLHRDAANLRLYGATKDGLLLETGAELTASRGRLKGQAQEADLSWTGGLVKAFSADGSRLLVAQDEEIWILPADRSRGRKIAMGAAQDLSQDGRLVLYTDPEHRVLVSSTEGGDLRVLATKEELQAQGLDPAGESAAFTRYGFSGDGRWVLIAGGGVLLRRPSDASAPLERVQVLPADLGEGARAFGAISPDGNRVAFQAWNGNRTPLFLAVDLATRKELARVQAQEGERLVGWGPDGFLVFASRLGKGEFRTVDPKGARRSLASVAPPFANATGRFQGVEATPEAGYYAYRYTSEGISLLVMAKGL